MTAYVLDTIVPFVLSIGAFLFGIGVGIIIGARFF